MEFLAGRLAARPQQAGSGSYRRIRPGEFRISAEVTAARARRLCDLLGTAGLLVCRADGADSRPYFIEAFRKEIGAPTGQPPRVSPFHMELDLSDARVRLRRRRKLDRLWRSVQALADIRRAEAAAHAMRGHPAGLDASAA
jgi:hypothetical protein